MWLQIINETLPALQKLKAEGLVRFIGITGLPLKIFRTVLDRHALFYCSVQLGNPFATVGLTQSACICAVFQWAPWTPFCPTAITPSVIRR